MFRYFGITIFTLIIYQVLTQDDPCSIGVYQELSDVTMKSDYKLGFGNALSNRTTITGWVRYTATANGSLMTTCPDSSECGVIYQYWMNDSLPSSDEGVTTVAVCGRVDKDCCDEEDVIEVKNCTDYVVYKLKQVDENVRYCFAADPITTTTIQTTTTTGAPPTPSNTTYTDETSGSVNIVLIAAIVGSVVVMTIVIVIVCVVIRKKISNRYVGNMDNTGTEWQTLNIAAIYRTKRKDLLIPRLMYLSGKRTTNSSMVYLNPRDEDFVDMREREALPRTRSELEIFSSPEIKRLGIDISAVYQTPVVDTFIANTKFSMKRMQGDHVISVSDVNAFLPYYNVENLKFY